MTPGRKRRLTYITIGVFFLLGGVEYGMLICYTVALLVVGITVFKAC